MQLTQLKFFVVQQKLSQSFMTFIPKIGLSVRYSVRTSDKNYVLEYLVTITSDVH